ncbi:MAG TPA: alpha/beta fold hydrolase [Solirubrobacteraceae bacterium]
MTSDTHTAERIAIGSGEISIRSGGDGPPLLFLHGGGGAGQWQPAHALLAAHHRVIAPDHPGFGSSDELPEVEGVDDLVYHYLDVIDHLGLERPAIVGHSFGGWVAAEIAVHSPERVGALVLLSPVGLRIPEHPITDIFFVPPREIPAMIFHDPSALPALDGPPDPDMLLAIYRDSTALARYTWSPFMANPKLERRLHRISAPTLVVWPEGDRVVPRAHAERYVELIPDARLLTIPECGHALALERPGEVAAAIGEFLDETEAGR